VEGYRSTLNIALNPENIFVLESQGVGVTSALEGLNRWNVYFRVSRQFNWGGALPTKSFEQFVKEQRPVVGFVEGFVREKASSGESPAPGVTILIDGYRRATTDREGKYRFPDIPEGRYDVAISLPELPADYEGGGRTEDLVIVKPQKVSRVDFEVFRLGQVIGRVLVPKDVLPDSIVIRLLPTTRYTTPAQDGSFGFYNVKEGDYRVEVDATTLPVESRLASPTRVPVMVRMGQDTPQIEFRLEKVEVVRPIRRINLPGSRNEAKPAAPAAPAQKAAPVPPGAPQVATKAVAAPAGTCGEWKGGVLRVEPCAAITDSPEKWLAGERPAMKTASRKHSVSKRGQWRRRPATSTGVVRSSRTNT
jgi:hypothetical protein